MDGLYTCPDPFRQELVRRLKNDLYDPSGLFNGIGAAISPQELNCEQESAAVLRSNDLMTKIEQTPVPDRRPIWHEIAECVREDDMRKKKYDDEADKLKVEYETKLKQEARILIRALVNRAELIDRELAAEDCVGDEAGISQDAETTQAAGTSTNDQTSLPSPPMERRYLPTSEQPRQKRKYKARRATTYRKTKRPRFQAPSEANRDALPDDGNQQSAQLPNENGRRRTITFDEVYQGGNAAKKYFIEKGVDGCWYIAECLKHRKMFKSRPLAAGKNHLKRTHKIVPCDSALVLELLGTEVLNCTAELAELNNRAAEAARSRTTDEPVDPTLSANNGDVPADELLDTTRSHDFDEANEGQPEALNEFNDAAFEEVHDGEYQQPSYETEEDSEREHRQGQQAEQQRGNGESLDNTRDLRQEPTQSKYDLRRTKRHGVRQPHREEGQIKDLVEGDVYRVYFEKIDLWLPVVLLPLNFLSDFGVDKTMEELGLVATRPSCCDYSPEFQRMSWAKGYDDNDKGKDCGPKARKYPVIKLNGSSWPSYNAVDWVEAVKFCPYQAPNKASDVDERHKNQVAQYIASREARRNYQREERERLNREQTATTQINNPQPTGARSAIRSALQRDMLMTHTTEEDASSPVSDQIEVASPDTAVPDVLDQPRSSQTSSTRSTFAEADQPSATNRGQTSHYEFEQGDKQISILDSTAQTDSIQIETNGDWSEYTNNEMNDTNSPLPITSHSQASQGQVQVPSQPRNQTDINPSQEFLQAVELSRSARTAVDRYHALNQSTVSSETNQTTSIDELDANLRYDRETNEPASSTWDRGQQLLASRPGSRPQGQIRNQTRNHAFGLDDLINCDPDTAEEINVPPQNKYQSRQTEQWFQQQRQAPMAPMAPMGLDSTPLVILNGAQAHSPLPQPAAIPPHKAPLIPPMGPPDVWQSTERRPSFYSHSSREPQGSHSRPGTVAGENRPAQNGGSAGGFGVLRPSPRN